MFVQMLKVERVSHPCMHAGAVRNEQQHEEASPGPSRPPAAAMQHRPATHEADTAIEAQSEGEEEREEEEEEAQAQQPVQWCFVQRRRGNRSDKDLDLFRKLPHLHSQARFRSLAETCPWMT